MKVISVSWKISIYWLYYRKRILKIIHLGFHNVFLEFTFESIFDEVEITSEILMKPQCEYPTQEDEETMHSLKIWKVCRPGFKFELHN